MNQKNTRSVFAILLLAAAIYGCSVRGIQSPIVLRSPVVLEETEVQEPPQTSVSLPSRETVGDEKSSLQESEQALSPGDIQILSFNDLVHIKFKIVGEISVRDRSKTGFTQEEAIKALKTKAFRNYPHHVKGLVNIKLVRKEKIFYYTKVRRSISTPKELDTYKKASAEVVTWNKGS